MSGYTKLFNRILDSTIWREDDRTRILWITMLAMTDRDGIVRASIPGLADRARISIEDCEAALAKFQQPDKYSTSQEDDGRRIRQIDGGWVLINHGKYRALMSAEDQREKARIRKQNQRTRDKRDMSQAVTPGHECHDIAKAKADTKAGKSKACALRAPRTFVPPSIPEVIAYCKERNNSVDPRKWFDHYQANGWRVGKNAMKDWRASVRTWERNGYAEIVPPIPSKPAVSVQPTYDIPVGLDADAGEDLWNAAKELLASTINEHTFSTWIEPVKQVGIRDGVLFLTVPSVGLGYVETKFGSAISEALGGMRVKFLIPEAQAAAV